MKRSTPTTAARPRGVKPEAGRHCPSIVLPGESQEAFHALLNRRLSKLKPADVAERDIVDYIVFCEWRQRRMKAIENRRFQDAIGRRTDTDEIDRLTGALSDLAFDPNTHAICRYQRHLSRSRRRALETLSLLRKMQNDETNLDSRKPNATNTIEDHS